MKRWTQEEINVLKENYNKISIDKLCHILHQRTKMSIEWKASSLGLTHKTASERFWSYVDKKSNDECWNWIGSYDRKYYGQIKICKKFIKAHRFSWVLHFGEIPDGICVLHHCDNPKCVNPSHLFLGTQEDNIKDRDNKHRQAKGENHWCHKLTLNQIKEIRKLKGKFFQKDIAKMFNVSQSTICCIHNNRTWK